VAEPLWKESPLSKKNMNIAYEEKRRVLNGCEELLALIDTRGLISYLGRSIISKAPNN
jgi:hypothetical protein